MKQKIQICDECGAPTGRCEDDSLQAFEEDTDTILTVCPSCFEMFEEAAAERIPPPCDPMDLLADCDKPPKQADSVQADPAPRMSIDVNNESTPGAYQGASVTVKAPAPSEDVIRNMNIAYGREWPGNMDAAYDVARAHRDEEWAQAAKKSGYTDSFEQIAYTLHNPYPAAPRLAPTMEEIADNQESTHQAESNPACPTCGNNFKRNYSSKEDEPACVDEWHTTADLSPVPSGEVIARMTTALDPIIDDAIKEDYPQDVRDAVTAAYKVATAGMAHEVKCRTCGATQLDNQCASCHQSALDNAATFPAGMVSLDAVEKCVGAYLLDEHGWNVGDALFAASKVRARLTDPSKTPEERVTVKENWGRFDILLDGLKYGVAYQKDDAEFFASCLRAKLEAKK